MAGRSLIARCIKQVTEWSFQCVGQTDERLQGRHPIFAGLYEGNPLLNPPQVLGKLRLSELQIAAALTNKASQTFEIWISGNCHGRGLPAKPPRSSVGMKRSSRRPRRQVAQYIHDESQEALRTYIIFIIRPHATP